MNSVMGSCAEAKGMGGEFYDNHWFESYHCDPVPEPAIRPSYGATCARWWNKGAKKRVLRFYDQPNGWDWWTALSAAAGAPKPVTVYGARQIDVPNDEAAGKGGATLRRTHHQL